MSCAPCCSTEDRRFPAARNAPHSTQGLLSDPLASAYGSSNGGRTPPEQHGSIQSKSRIVQPFSRGESERTGLQQRSQGAGRNVFIQTKTAISAFAMAALLFPASSWGECACKCVDGKVQAICTSSLDLKPICAPRICPMVPPSVRPIQPPVMSPLGTDCRKEPVLNPKTNVYEWQTICQNQRQARQPETPPAGQ
jgi:hypothetical protein